jgi:hypothetical protein
MSDPMAAIQSQQSIMNPTDASMMGQNGEITPEMTVREYLAKEGIDVEGPVTQLIDMAKGQMQMADPMNKMKAFAGRPQPGQAPQPPAGRVPQGAGMERLLNQM